MAKRKKVVSLRLESRMLDDLDRVAGECRITRSSLAEKIFHAFLSQDRPTQNAALGRKGAGDV